MAIDSFLKLGTLKGESVVKGFEDQMQLLSWGWGYDKGQVLSCHQLYHHLFPRLIDQEDPTRYYQPSSPYSPDHKDPNADDRGDLTLRRFGLGQFEVATTRAYGTRLQVPKLGAQNVVT